jgi:hypothetical protein
MTETVVFSQVKRDHDFLLVCAMELAQASGKIVDGVLMMNKEHAARWGGVASSLRRTAARLEVIGTTNEPDYREFPKGELNWTEDQKNKLHQVFLEYNILKDNPSSVGDKLFREHMAEVENLFFPAKKNKTTF